MGTRIMIKKVMWRSDDRLISPVLITHCAEWMKLHMCCLCVVFIVMFIKEAMCTNTASVLKPQRSCDIVCPISKWS